MPPNLLRLLRTCRRPRRPVVWRAAATALVAGAALAAASPAAAQLRLGGGPGGLGGLGGLGGPDLGGLVQRGEGTLGRPLRDTVPDAAGTARRLVRQREDTLAALLQGAPERLERLPDGRVVVRGELLLQAPSPALRAAARAAGFQLVREEPLDALGIALVVLHAPAGLDTAAALARLQALDAGQAADVNPLYLPAGEGLPTPPTPSRVAPPTEAPSAPAPPAAARPAEAGVRIGLVDGAPDAQHPALRPLALQAFNAVPGCAPGTPPDAHGTAVASLLAGRDGRFRGAAPGAALYAADIYCGATANGSAEAVLRALAWLAGQQVPVINLSIVGPPNRLLERAVDTLVRRGYLLVAAVGNDGPASPPLYPAAYRGVIGVTGVTPQGRVLPEALQGPQVAFAAPGAVVAAAASGDGAAGPPWGYRAVRGTSFAAPFVAGLLAQRLGRPEARAAAAARAALAREAIDLGARGPDAVYGDGWVARTLRVDPAAVDAADSRAAAR